MVYENEKLIQRMRLLGYKEHWINYTVNWINEIKILSVDGVDRWMRKIITNARPECSDHIAALRFASALAKNNFTQIELEPFESGPDIKAKWNRRFMYFEVTRWRPEVDEWADDFDPNKVTLTKVENIIEKIQNKNRQLINNEINVVVLWSDTWKVEIQGVEEAVKYIEQEITQNRGTYKKLSSILFTTGGLTYTCNTLKQFSIFKNKNAQKPINISLERKLERLSELNPKQLKEEHKEFTNIIKKAKSQKE